MPLERAAERVDSAAPAIRVRVRVREGVSGQQRGALEDALEGCVGQGDGRSVGWVPGARGAPARVVVPVAVDQLLVDVVAVVVDDGGDGAAVGDLGGRGAIEADHAGATRVCAKPCLVDPQVGRDRVELDLRLDEVDGEAGVRVAAVPAGCGLGIRLALERLDDAHLEVVGRLVADLDRQRPAEPILARAEAPLVKRRSGLVVALRVGHALVLVAEGVEDPARDLRVAGAARALCPGRGRDPVGRPLDRGLQLPPDVALVRPTRAAAVLGAEEGQGEFGEGAVVLRVGSRAIATHPTLIDAERALVRKENQDVRGEASIESSARGQCATQLGVPVPVHGLVVAAPAAEMLYPRDPAGDGQVQGDVCELTAGRAGDVRGTLLDGPVGMGEGVQGAVQARDPRLGPLLGGPDDGQRAQGGGLVGVPWQRKIRLEAARRRHVAVNARGVLAGAADGETMVGCARGVHASAGVLCQHFCIASLLLAGMYVREPDIFLLLNCTTPVLLHHQVICPAIPRERL